MIEHFPESHDMTQTIRGKKILVMSVDIGDGRTGKIEVYEADEPEDLASEFCAVYDLNSKVRSALARQIEDNIELLVNEVLGHRPRTYDHQPQINERSRVLAYHKTKENVYARLYRQIPKHTASQSPEKPQPRARSPPKTIKAISIGDRLYYKGLKMKEASAQAKAEFVQQRQAKEDLDLTFTPSFCSRSRSLLKYTPPDQSYRDRSESREEKVRSLKERLEKEEIAKCSFTPEVSRGSTLIALKKRISSQERIRNLYDEGKKRTERCRSKAERL
jgi:hypothetical protein